ncbi:MAG: DivIVA protein [Actinomycetota bacterium]|jgi:DivIVA domain-containing protein|nr:DivIVA protein [Actinomycetota bacterium]
MSSTDLDLPLLPSAEQIRRREFATIRRGYDPEQVREYLAQVSTQVETLEKELREARLSSEKGPAIASEPAQPQIDPYEQFAKRMAGLLATADREAQRLVEEAGSESGRMIGEARTEADRIRVDAQSRAEEARQEGSEFLQHAQEEADRVLSTLSSRRETLVDQLQQMQSHLLGVANELEAVIVPAASGDADAIEAAARASSPADPRYEELWVATAFSDLPPIEFDLDVEPGDSGLD